jgi:hypothetical protein
VTDSAQAIPELPSEREIDRLVSLIEPLTRVVHARERTSPPRLRLGA